MDVARGEYSIVSCFKAWQELKLCDIVDLVAHKVFGLAPVRLLQRGKTAYIKWLQEVRRVRRHTYSDNLVIFAVLLEI